MLDTVNFKLTQAEVEGVDFLDEITPNLNPEGVAFHDYNGQRVITGKTGNLSVSISPYQVRVKTAHYANGCWAIITKRWGEQI